MKVHKQKQNHQNSNTAAYVRVSSQDQNDQLQRDAIRAWAKSQQIEVVYYADQFSGKTMDRPGWNQLWQNVSEGRIKQIVTWKLDRLGRTASGLTTLFDELHQRGINFVSLTEGINLDTPSGRMTAAILASVAQFERELRSERQMAGIEAVRRRNNGECTWGGSKPGIPKKLNDSQIDYIRSAHKSGISISQIARTVGVTRKTIYRVLSWK